MAGSVIVAGARTPIGKLSGALAGFTAMNLGGFAIKAALERAGLTPEEVDYVFMGQVIGAGQGQITARQAAVNAGIPIGGGCDHRQQGVPVRSQHDLSRRPDDPGGRGRDRRRRRHGVDDERAVHPAGCARRPPIRRRVASGLDHPRRPLVRVRRVPHGRWHREVLRVTQHLARTSGRARGEEPRAGRRRDQGRAVQRRARRRRDPAAQG